MADERKSKSDKTLTRRGRGGESESPEDCVI